MGTLSSGNIFFAPNELIPWNKFPNSGQEEKSS